MTEITDADREAAADFADWHEGFSENDVAQLAKALAKHREAACRELVEALVSDFRERARLCRTNDIAFDTKAAAIWEFAADAVAKHGASQ